MSALRRPKILYLDYYRAISILAVGLIHVTSNPMVKLQSNPNSWLSIFYSFINKFSQFAVPSFIFLSGLVLFYNYWKPEKQGMSWVGKFYRKRILFIVVPYILWSFIYNVLVHSLNKQGIGFDGAGYLKALFTGDNYEHLYFVVIIIQFYVLFPFLLEFCRSKRMVRLMIPFALLFQIGFFVLNKEVFHLTASSLFASYFLQYSLGAFIGINFESAMAFLRRWKWQLALVVAISGITYVFAGKMYYQWFPELIPYKAYMNFVIYYVFTSTASVLILLVSSGLYHLLKESWVAKLGVALGAGSFTIFLVHPMLLKMWRTATVHYSSSLQYHLFIWLGGLVVLALSWAFYALLRKVKWSWVLIGKG